jgi:uncharacterized membrane protein YhaH (DUF805 family)
MGESISEIGRRVQGISGPNFRFRRKGKSARIFGMADNELESTCPGIDRLYYFLARIAMAVVITFAIMYFGFESGVIAYLSLAISIASTILDVMRLRNIGVSQWFVFLRFVPYVGLLLSIGLQSAQTGWVDTKRLDRAGWAILATHAAIIAVMVYLLSKANIEIFGISL